MLRLGVGMSAAFVVLRALNVYGDPSPWETQIHPAMTVLSFISAANARYVFGGKHGGRRARRNLHPKSVSQS